MILYFDPETDRLIPVNNDRTIGLNHTNYADLDPEVLLSDLKEFDFGALGPVFQKALDSVSQDDINKTINKLDSALFNTDPDWTEIYQERIDALHANLSDVLDHVKDKEYSGHGGKASLPYAPTPVSDDELFDLLGIPNPNKHQAKLDEPQTPLNTDDLHTLLDFAQEKNTSLSDLSHPSSAPSFTLEDLDNNSIPGFSVFTDYDEDESLDLNPNWYLTNNETGQKFFVKR